MSDKEPILNSEDFDIDFQDFSNTIASIPDDAATIPTSQFSSFEPAFQPGLSTFQPGILVFILIISISPSLLLWFSLRNCHLSLETEVIQVTQIISRIERFMFLVVFVSGWIAIWTQATGRTQNSGQLITTSRLPNKKIKSFSQTCSNHYSDKKVITVTWYIQTSRRTLR